MKHKEASVLSTNNDAVINVNMSGMPKMSVADVHYGCTVHAIDTAVAKRSSDDQRGIAFPEPNEIDFNRCSHF